jgi:hypothetical protein
MSDVVTVRFEENGFAQIRLFGGTVSLNPAQLENPRAALLPPGVESPERPAEKPEPEEKPVKKKPARKGSDVSDG